MDDRYQQDAGTDTIIEIRVRSPHHPEAHVLIHGNGGPRHWTYVLKMTAIAIGRDFSDIIRK